MRKSWLIFLCLVCVAVAAPSRRTKRDPGVEIPQTVSFPEVPLVVSVAAASPAFRRSNTRSRSIYQATQTVNQNDGSYIDQVSIDPEYNQFPQDDLSLYNALENRLYFNTVPHKKLLLRTENIREINGLPRHLLESIRPYHPFYVAY